LSLPLPFFPQAFVIPLSKTVPGGKACETIWHCDKPVSVSVCMYLPLLYHFIFLRILCTLELINNVLVPEGMFLQITNMGFLASRRTILEMS
jgi:hypothetical protein